MATVFLDTNAFIDSIHRRPEKEILKRIKNHIVYISPLSFHIYCYVYKIKIPNTHIVAQKDKFQIVEFSESILETALDGPTPDFEDNVQLHSAAHSDCEMFVTSDKKLLSLKFFGKLQIISPVQLT